MMVILILLLIGIVYRSKPEDLSKEMIEATGKLEESRARIQQSTDKQIEGVRLDFEGILKSTAFRYEVRRIVEEELRAIQGTSGSTPEEESDV